VCCEVCNPNDEEEENGSPEFEPSTQSESPIRYENVLRTPILRGFVTTLLILMPCGFGLTGHAAPKSAPAVLAAGSSAAQSRVTASYGKIPLSFESNQGQTDSSVRFLSPGSAYSLFLTPGEVVLSLEMQNFNIPVPTGDKKTPPGN
jgi:hypothetical protein